MNSFLFWMTLLFFPYPLVLAQTQLKAIPVTASPLESFSEKSLIWPTESIPVQTDQTLYQNLSHESDFQVRQNGSPTVSVRGSGSLARTLLLFQDIPLNTADGLGASSLLLPTEISSEVKVLKGPASLFYGADAMSGAVNLLASPSNVDRFLFGYGSQNESRILLCAPFAKKSDTTGYQISAFQFHSDGDFPYRYTLTNQTGSREKNDQTLRRYTLIGKKKWNGTLFEQALVYGTEFGSSAASLDYAGATPTSYDRKAWLASNTISKSFSENASFKNRTSVLQVENRYTDDLYKPSKISNQSILDLTHTENLSSNFQIDYAHHEYTERSGAERNYVNDQLDFALATIFSSAPYTLQPGVRYLTQYQKPIFAIANNFDFYPFQLWLNYSEGYRAPSLTDRFSNTSFFIGNSQLQPESSSQVELGLQKNSQDEWGHGQNFSTTLFAVSYKDLVQNKRISTTLSQPENRGMAETYGAEAKANFEYDFFKIMAGLTFMKSKSLTQDRALRLSPDVQSVLQVSHYWGAIEISLKDTYWGRYYDESYTTNQLVDMGSFQTVDLEVKTRGLQNMTAVILIKNIFDTPRSLTLGYPEPQRSLWASFEKGFD